MKDKTRNKAKQAMIKIQQTIDLLEQITEENEQIEDTAQALGFAMADLEHEVNSH